MKSYYSINTKGNSYLEFLQDFVILPMIFTKVFHFFALRTASIVFHFSTLWVNFRTFWLVANRSIQSTDTWTVGMSWEKSFSQLVYKAAVIHTPFPSIVIKNQIVITGDRSDSGEEGGNRIKSLGGKSQVGKQEEDR